MSTLADVRTWWWDAIARRFPEIARMQGRERTAVGGDVLCVLYSAPLALAGLLWLIWRTDVQVAATLAPFTPLLLALMFAFEKFDFYTFIEVTAGTYADWRWTLVGAMLWSWLLRFGPTALWFAVLWQIVRFAYYWRRANTLDWRWNLTRHLTFYWATMLGAGMIGLQVYEHLGGVYPLTAAWRTWLPAFAALALWLILAALLWAPLLLYFSLSHEFAWTRSPLGTFARFMAVTMGWRALVNPWAIFAAGLWARDGLPGYLIFIGGLLAAALLAHELSRAIERSQLRSRELEKLELLSRALMTPPFDAARLPQLLAEHVGAMFPYGHLEIRLFPMKERENNTLPPTPAKSARNGETYLHTVPDMLLHTPANWPPLAEKVWEWLRDHPVPHTLYPHTPPPWSVTSPQADGPNAATRAILLAPILDMEADDPQAAPPLGGIYLERYRNPDTIALHLPAVQSLAAQIASALHGAKVYAQQMAYQRMLRELELAGQIQATFLPRHLPEIPGWGIKAYLTSAQETSGDFFDVIPLDNALLGIVVADVADKGTGAALYMALSRTLIRTYARQYPTSPDHVMSVTNQRIFDDAEARLFVTVFYGVLDTRTGLLTYANAGHPPPYLLRAGNATAGIRSLHRSGLPLGVSPDATWSREQARLGRGDLLVLYTDGILDAENAAGDFFGQERLLNSVQALRTRPPAESLAALLAQVQEFVGDAPQLDDITVMTITRDAIPHDPHHA